MKLRGKLILSFIPFLFFTSCKTQEINECDHEYVKIIVEPTCTEKGYTINKCQKCDTKYNSDYVNKLNHEYNKTFKEEADGSVYYELNCSRCNGISKEYLTTKINDLYGFKDLNRYANKAKFHEFYADIIMKCDSFMNSSINLDLTNININNEIKSYYIIDKIDYSSNIKLNEALAIMNLVSLDNPKYYFLSNTIVYDQKYIYIITNENCAKYENRNLFNIILAQLKLNVNKELNNLTTTKDKIRYLHDLVIGEVEYAYKDDLNTPEDADWAHTIIGPVVYKKGVCEAYSKAFKYLCDEFKIDCLIVNGVANGSTHSWNLVKIDDNWYGIDLTFDDQKTYISYDYYLMGFAKMKENYVQYSSLNLSSKYVYLTPTLALNDFYMNICE